MRKNIRYKLLFVVTLLTAVGQFAHATACKSMMNRTTATNGAKVQEIFGEQVVTSDGVGLVIGAKVPSDGIQYEPDRVSLVVWFGIDHQGGGWIRREYRLDEVQLARQEEKKAAYNSFSQHIQEETRSVGKTFLTNVTTEHGSGVVVEIKMNSNGIHVEPHTTNVTVWYGVNAPGPWVRKEIRIYDLNHSN